MKIEANSPEDYMEQLPEERKAVFGQLRETIIQNLPDGFEETMSYGMLGYVVPHSIYPEGYHCDPKLPLPFMNIASQKHFIGVYHMGIYTNSKLMDWFVNEYPKYCNTKLDMGKSCIRLKKMDQIPFKLFAELTTKMTVKDWILLYEKNVKR